jgi:hypothetical protein
MQHSFLTILFLIINSIYNAGIFLRTQIIKVASKGIFKNTHVHPYE